MKTIKIAKGIGDILTIKVNKKTIRIHALIDNTGNSWTLDRKDLEA